MKHLDFPELDISNALLDKALSVSFRRGLLIGSVLTSLFWTFILTYLAL